MACYSFSSPFAAAAVFICAIPLPGDAGSRSPVVLTEVMYDPAGSEHHDEFVELLNTSDVERVDLTGWCLGDADEVDLLQGIGGGMILAPGQLALVLDGSYFGQSTTYDSMRTTALMLTIDDRAFGRAGWSNSSTESVVLCDAKGDTVDVVTYEPAKKPGLSLEKVDPGRGDSGIWILSYVPGGTPGAPNSVSSQAASAGAKIEVIATPDPFVDQVEIVYRLPAAPAVVSVAIYNVEGQKVRQLASAAPAGRSGSITWRGTDDVGRSVPIGIYIIHVEASSEGRAMRAKTVIVRQSSP